MAGTLILLYALNASQEIPVGCFIAAWAIDGIVRLLISRTRKK